MSVPRKAGSIMLRKRKEKKQKKTKKWSLLRRTNSWPLWWFGKGPPRESRWRWQIPWLDIDNLMSRHARTFARAEERTDAKHCFIHSRHSLFLYPFFLFFPHSLFLFAWLRIFISAGVFSYSLSTTTTTTTILFSSFILILSFYFRYAYLLH